MLSTNFFRFFAVLFFGVALLAACSEIKTSVETVKAESAADVATASAIPTPMPKTAAKGEQTAVFAGGCFWGLEAVFEHIKGVSDVTNGYSGGTAKTADYETVSGGETGHAESVKITFESKSFYQSFRRRSLRLTLKSKTSFL
jgi:peptide-methionine (S)-S-oxide reductase